MELMNSNVNVRLDMKEQRVRKVRLILGIQTAKSAVSVGRACL